MSQGLFVTGTDTGAGKTLVSCVLLTLLRRTGLDAVGFKPVATGQESGKWLDIEALFEASGGVEPRERICPLRFSASMAPVQAAKREGIELDIGPACRALEDLTKRHAFVVAEGIGGLLVPLDARTLVLDFIKQSGFRAIVVCKAQLGTVNHTLLTLRELKRAGVPVAAVIMNVTRPEDAENARPSAEEIERHAPHRVAATIPFCGGPATPQSELAAKAAEILGRQIQVSALVGR